MYVVVCTKKSGERWLSSLLSIHNVMVDYRIIPRCNQSWGKRSEKQKKTRSCDCPIAAQVNPLVTPSHHAVNSVAKRMHGCSTRLNTPASFTICTGPLVLATSSSLAFSFPFPPKREDPEKRHTGNPVRHNCPKTLLMSRGRKLTNADPNLYIRM